MKYIMKRETKNSSKGLVWAIPRMEFPTLIMRKIRGGRPRILIWTLSLSRMVTSRNIGQWECMSLEFV